MTHEEIRANLLAAMDGTLDPDAIDEIERHMAECADCRMEQVELNRMRRSMDREEASSVPPAKRSFWGSLGSGGMPRLVLIVAFMGAVLWAMARKKAPAAPSRSPAPATARVFPMGEGVACGNPGNLMGIAKETWLPLGQEVAVRRGARARIRLGPGKDLILDGPASGELRHNGSWRHRGGRLLIVGNLVLAVGVSLEMDSGPEPIAVWDVPEGTRIEYLDSGASKLLDLGDPSFKPVPAEHPAWAEDLRALLAPETTLVPGVTLIPEGR